MLNDLAKAVQSDKGSTLGLLTSVPCWVLSLRPPQRLFSGEGNSWLISDGAEWGQISLKQSHLLFKFTLYIPGFPSKHFACFCK